MARSKEPLLDPLLRRGEDAGMVVSAAALALVEVGYVAWLERLPAFPSPAHPAEFFDLPLWYEHPRVGVTLLLTVLGGDDRVGGLECFRFHMQQVARDGRGDTV